MFWVVGWCQWYGYLVLLKGRGGVGEGGLGDSQIQPKKEDIGMKARGIMKKSKDRGIFSSVISYICP